MTDISVYFAPIDIGNFTFFNSNIERLGHLICSFNTNSAFPTLNNNIDIAIFGVGEQRGNKNNEGCEDAPDAVRKYLYNLTLHYKHIQIVDLGNLRTGNTANDTYIAVGEVVSTLLQLKIIPVILGGSHDVTYGNYLGYEKLGQIINMFCVDSCVDLGLVKDNNEMNAETFLTNIMCCEPNYLFNYTHVGFQTYFVDRKMLNVMNDLHFDFYRLGTIQQDIKQVEPLVRNADMVSVDISAVRHSDAPASHNPSPHGLYGEELCQICRYAGMSDKLTSIGFYELNPRYDNRGQTAALVAHAVWYFIDGYLWRKRDFPYLDSENFIEFIVSLNEGKSEMIFLKSKKSERWWMQVPCSKDLQEKYQRHYLVPCSYDDYNIAAEYGKIPDRWFNAYNKIGK